MTKGRRSESSESDDQTLEAVFSICMLQIWIWTSSWIILFPHNFVILNHNERQNSVPTLLNHGRNYVWIVGYAWAQAASRTWNLSLTLWLTPDHLIGRLWLPSWPVGVWFLLGICKDKMPTRTTVERTASSETDRLKSHFCSKGNDVSQKTEVFWQWKGQYLVKNSTYYLEFYFHIHSFSTHIIFCKVTISAKQSQIEKCFVCLVRLHWVNKCLENSKKKYSTRRKTWYNIHLAQYLTH